MNFNLKSNEYDLQASQTRELIRLYGIPCKLLLAERINKDLIFGDHSHIKVDNKSVFDIHLLPENSEEYDQMDKLQTQFGIPVETSVNFFVAKKSINEKIQQSINVDSYNEFNILEPDDTIKRIISSLLIMPSGKILEITNVDFECVGTNNMFVYNYSKNVCKLFCKIILGSKTATKTAAAIAGIITLNLEKDVFCTFSVFFSPKTTKFCCFNSVFSNFSYFLEVLLLFAY